MRSCTLSDLSCHSSSPSSSRSVGLNDASASANSRWISDADETRWLPFCPNECPWFSSLEMTSSFVCELRLCELRLLDDRLAPDGGRSYRCELNTGCLLTDSSTSLKCFLWPAIFAEPSRAEPLDNALRLSRNHYPRPDSKFSKIRRLLSRILVLQLQTMRPVRPLHMSVSPPFHIVFSKATREARTTPWERGDWEQVR